VHIAPQTELIDTTRPTVVADPGTSASHQGL